VYRCPSAAPIRSTAITSNSLNLWLTAIELTWISNHPCWTRLHDKNLHDLLPLRYTEEAIAHVAARIEQVQHA